MPGNQRRGEGNYKGRGVANRERQEIEIKFRIDRTARTYHQQNYCSRNSRSRIIRDIKSY
jgi:hypothetical protein